MALFWWPGVHSSFWAKLMPVGAAKMAAKLPEIAAARFCRTGDRPAGRTERIVRGRKTDRWPARGPVVLLIDGDRPVDGDALRRDEPIEIPPPHAPLAPHANRRQLAVPDQTVDRPDVNAQIRKDFLGRQENV